MIGLEPTTVAKAGSYMAQFLGLSWPRDREEVLSKINDFRDLTYTDPNLTLFDNVTECIAVSNYRMGCLSGQCGVDPCDDNFFQGFVLPEHLISISAAWESKRPLNIRTRWRETQQGLSEQERGDRVSVTETSTLVPTERPMLHSGRLKMFASRPEDTGKEVLLDVVIEGNVHRRISFKLQFDQWVESRETIVSIDYVSLPADRVGTVTLAEATDLRILSVYEPWEDVPSYRLFRLSSRCPSGFILLQGVRRFREVAYDHEMVEIGSRTVLRHAAEHLRYGIGTVETADNQKSANAYASMIGAIRGLMNRSRGEAKQDPHPFAGRQVSPSNILPGYKRR
jgi:hypothetical protein